MRRGEKRTLHTDYTIGIDASEVMKIEALECIQKGFPALKVNLGKKNKKILEMVTHFMYS